MLTLFRWLSRWPLWLLHALGGLVGWASFLLSPGYRRRFRANVAQAGVGAGHARPAVAEAGRMLLEVPWLWMRPAARPILPRVRWDGAEPIDAAHREGR